MTEAGRIASLSDHVGGDTFVVTAAGARGFGPGELVALVRDEDARGQRLWLEALVSGYVLSTNRRIWWVEGADGYDYLLTRAPADHLAKSARRVTLWALRSGKVHAEAPRKDLLEWLEPEGEKNA